VNGTAQLVSVFVEAAGMADDHARAWLDHRLPNWRRTWPRRGRAVLAEVEASGHTPIAARLVELLGDPR
jgi:hypothetical protein